MENNLEKRVKNLYKQSHNLEVFFEKYKESINNGTILKDNSLLFYPAFKDILNYKEQVVNKFKEISKEHAVELNEILMLSKNLQLNTKNIKKIDFYIKKCFNAYLN